MKSTATTYSATGDNPTTRNSDNNKANLAFCFSGGGSRALTCAWGQMLGLKTLNLMDKARYISSVSGGTWATSIYNYLPKAIATDDLLGAYHQPENLSLNDGIDKFNINKLSKYSLGKVPQALELDQLIISGVRFLLTQPKSDHKWLWAYLIGKFVLAPYGLRSKGSEKWNSTKYIALSKAYAEANFPADAPPLTDFNFLRAGRPFHVINNNIMEKVVLDNGKVNIIQIPSQVTPVSAGARGKSPGKVTVGGGTVASYANSAQLEQKNALATPVKVSLSQPYSLIDAVSTSSAFFAEELASIIEDVLADEHKRKTIFSKINAELTPKHKQNLFTHIKKEIEHLKHASVIDILEYMAKKLHLAGELTLVPTYNYWPINTESTNKQTEYTDGGTLDNTGVLGMLSQTDTGSTRQEKISLVVFDNPEEAFTKKSGKLIAAGQIARLFGLSFNNSTGEYHAFTSEQKSPNHSAFTAKSLTAVFDNQPNASGVTPFETLLNGLEKTSCHSGEIGSDAPFCELELTTIANSLTSISAGRKVNMFYSQNAKMMNWQNKISDEKLKTQIATGQQYKNNNKSLIDAIMKPKTFAQFADFPYYNTITKIGLQPKESNALSQMWAWAVADQSSPLKSQIEAFINKAAKVETKVKIKTKEAVLS